MSDPRDFDRNKDFDRIRDFGPNRDLERDPERIRHSDAPAPTGSNAGWISAAVIALLLLGGLAIYASRDDTPRTAGSPATETTGQSPRAPAPSTAPAPSPSEPKAPMNTPAPASPSKQ
jgi:hypothetical protein